MVASPSRRPPKETVTSTQAGDTIRMFRPGVGGVDMDVTNFHDATQAAQIAALQQAVAGVQMPDLSNFVTSMQLAQVQAQIPNVSHLANSDDVGNLFSHQGILDGQIAVLQSTVAGKASAATVTTQAALISTLQGKVAALEAIKQPQFERVTGILGTGGTVDLLFTKTYTSPPLVISDAAWAGNQQVVSVPGAVTTTKVTVTAKRTKATLLLSAGPMEAAVAGDPVAVFVIGN